MQSFALVATSAAARSIEVAVSDIPATVSLYAADGAISEGLQVHVELRVNGLWRPYVVNGAAVILTHVAQDYVLDNPGVYSFRKGETAEAVGVILNNTLEAIEELVRQKRYYGTSLVTSAAPLSPGRVLLRTGATVNTHARLVVSAERKMYMDVYGAPTVTDNGVAQNVNNFFVGTPTPAQLQAFVEPVVSALGPRLVRFLITAGNEVVVGNTGGTFILPPNAVIVVEFSVDSGGVTDVGLDMNFWEQPLPLPAP